MAQGDLYGMSSGLQEILTRRKVEEQQALANIMAERQQQLREDQERRAAEFQQQQFKDQAYDRESRQADRIYEDLTPGKVTQEIADLLTRHGRGTGLTNTGAGQVGEAELDLDQEQVKWQGDGYTPEQMQMLDSALTGSIDDLQTKQTKQTIEPNVIMSPGGSKWQAAKVAQDARSHDLKTQLMYREEQARRDRDAANERAAADRAMRETVANIAATSRNNVPQWGSSTFEGTGPDGKPATYAWNKRTNKFEMVGVPDGVTVGDKTPTADNGGGGNLPQIFTPQQAAKIAQLKKNALNSNLSSAQSEMAQNELNAYISATIPTLINRVSDPSIVKSIQTILTDSRYSEMGTDEIMAIARKDKGATPSELLQMEAILRGLID